MRNTYTIHDDGSAAESLDVTLEVTPDPTGATPQFALSADGVNTPGSWSNGTLGTWSSTTKKVTCTSPTIGGTSATLQLTAGARYHLWVKLAAGAETYVRIAADIYCPG